MFYSCRVWVVLALLGSVVSDQEHASHGPNVLHHAGDGQHNAAYDHQAVLGSEELEKEFAGLPPEEAMMGLKKLAEKHDMDSDGQITKDELNKWITNSFLNLDREEGMEKFQEEDEDSDGQVTWKEYLNKMFGYTPEDVEVMRETVITMVGKSEEIRETENSLKMVDEDHQFFKGADLNNDGSLNPEEYMAFFFPQNYEHMHEFELDRHLNQHDTDDDRKISLAEFMPEGATSESRISAEENFSDLDVDKDGLLTEEELKEWVVPGADELVVDEANHLISMADKNGDDQLSIEEILEKTDLFVGSSATDYGNFLQHEEL